MLSGAKRAGLSLDTEAGTRIHNFKPDPLAPLVNEAHPKRSLTQAISGDREGPDHLWQLMESARRRWRMTADRLGGKPYRPGTLAKLKAKLDALGSWDFVPPTDLVATEKVTANDTLSLYAKRHYGDARLWPKIYEANLDAIDDPDEIFPGQEVRIPRLPLSN